MVATGTLVTLGVAGVASLFMAWAIGAGSSGSTPFAPAVARLAEDYGCSPAALALAWLQQLPGPVVPLVGTANPDHLADAIASADIELRRDHWYELMVMGRGRNLPYYHGPFAYVGER